MRHAAAAALAVLALVLARGTAHGQGAAPAASPAETAELHRLRGTIAWRRAVWRAQRDGFQRAVTELERARATAEGRSDFTSLYLLGLSYLRLGRAADAEPVLRDARAMSPGFAGFVLTDALQLTATKAASTDQARKEVDAALAKYDEYLAKIAAYPKDGPFAAELLFLGYLFRGRTNARISARYDKAVDDLDRALRVAADNGEQPPAEVVSLLAQMHQHLDQIDVAKKLVLAALERDPAEAVHYYNFGAILVGAHDEAGARPWLEAALARRPEFPEAHMRLAYIASKTDDPASMRRHLEAAAAIYAARARAGVQADRQTDADVESGFGQYWMLVAKHRQDAGDEAGTRAAYENAKDHLRQALAKEPGCVGALNVLVQVCALTDAPEAEIDDLKRRLADISKLSDREIDPYHGTFC
jgi:tetratricopeptide (TPR) repeat protein